MCRAGCRSVRLTRGTTASIYPADTMPASQPASVLVRDQVSMNCGSSAGTVENPARPRISAPHTAATLVAEGPAGAAVAELTAYNFHLCALLHDPLTSFWGLVAKRAAISNPHTWHRAGTAPA